jgi:hypothetical protein
MRLNLPTANIITLALYHSNASNHEIEDWLHLCTKEDYNLAISIQENYRSLKLGSRTFKSMFGEKLFFNPILHSDAFFPFFDNAKTTSG